MFVKLMEADDWQNQADRRRVVEDPNWGHIEAAIVGLDGKQRTLITLSNERDSDSYMLVAGPHDGRYLLNMTPNNQEFFSLVDSARSANKVIALIGGQKGDYSDCHFVPLDWVLAAAKKFYETGERIASTHWQSDY